MTSFSLGANLSGVLPIDKAAGMTSHDAVAIVRRVFRPEKLRVGHAGTLDPDATGLLLICIGSATRLADLLADRGKVYRAEFVLGSATSTEDSSGTVIGVSDASRVSREDVVTALASLTGEIEQVPPMVSALHHEGQRLYELARRGIEVERAARRVTVKRIDLTAFAPGSRAHGEFTVSCGKGVYVRTLCSDLGKILGVGGHMHALRRLSIGDFDIESALSIDNITADSVVAQLVPASDAVSFLPMRLLSDTEKDDVLHGRSLPLDAQSNSPNNPDLVRLVAGGELVALAVPDRLHLVLSPRKVLIPSK